MLRAKQHKWKMKNETGKAIRLLVDYMLIEINAIRLLVD